MTAGAMADRERLRRSLLGDSWPSLDARLLERLGRRALGRPDQSVDVEAPASGRTIGAVPSGDAATVAEAARRARAAQRAWVTEPVARRAQVLLRFHDLLLRRREEILEVVCTETGKVRADAFEELVDTANLARYYARTASQVLAPRRRRGLVPLATKVVEHHKPLGLVGCIAPWNYPLVLGITDALPALVAGNAVLVKPDPKTPFSALWAASLLDEAGLDPELVQVVVGDGDVLGDAVVDAVDFVMFTGSTRVGRRVAGRCGERLIGCSLELGGKNAMLVLDDVDLDRAATGAVGACFSNAGQLCMSMERLYVDRARIDEFAQVLGARTRALRIGGPDADVGSLIGAAQLARVTAHVEDAVAKGAVVVAGGRARPDAGPYCFEPTVLRDVTPDMLVAREETFGPVVALYEHDGDVDAVRLANASEFGLNCSIWTSDDERGTRLATRLEAGSVCVNDGYASAWASADAPMGGVKGSGLGRRHGAQGLLKYTEAQTVTLQRGMPLHAPARLGQQRWERGVVSGLHVLRRSGTRR